MQVDHTVAEVEWAAAGNGEAESIAALIARELRQVREETEAAARAWRNELMRTAGIRFGPIWHPPRRIVNSYRSLLNEQTGSHAMQRLAAVTTSEELKGTLNELDCLIVGSLAGRSGPSTGCCTPAAWRRCWSR